jgi:hypothetical protein
VLSSDATVRRTLALVALLVAAGGVRAWPAALRGTVTIEGRAVSGATVSIFDAGGILLARVVSGSDGRFDASGLPAGQVRVEARAQGLQAATATVVVAEGAARELRLEIPRALSDHVEVTYTARADSLAASLGPREELQGALLDRLPSGGGAVDDALVTLPGVVRSNEAVSLRGGRPDQSGMQLGSMTLSDPATGETRVRVPVDAVASVEVLSNPIAAELGRFSSGLVVMHPRGGGDEWRFSLRNLDPSFRRERGRPWHLLGVRSFAPRLSLSGPLVRGRLYLAQSVQYGYRVSELESRPQDETSRQQYLSLVTRLDYQASARHRLTGLLSLFPERRDRANLGTFVPPQSTYGQRVAISNASLSHTMVVGSRLVLESSLHLSRHRLWLTPTEAEPAFLQPQGAGGGFWNRQQRRSDAVQWVETLSFSGKGPLGEHMAVIGLDVLHAAVDGESESDPVEIRRLDGTLAQLVTFDGRSPQSVRSTDVAVFARTRWRPVPALICELGARLDRDGVTRGSILAPRLGASWTGLGRRLRLRAGVGLFAERTPSLVGAFQQIEGREETRFAEDGVTVIGATRYEHVSASYLLPARSTTWSGQVSYRPMPSLELRVSALERRGRHEPIVDPLGDGAEGRLLLETEGRSHYREAELGLRFAPRPKRELSVSWVHSRSEADLNSFVSIFGTARAVVVRPNAFGLANVDVPDRLVARLSTELGREWYLTGMLEARRGTPWSAVDENLDFVGARNASGRLPAAVLLDLAVERRFRLGRFRPWIGVGGVNLLNQFAARDVQANVTAPDFGKFYNPVPRRLRLYLTLNR